MSYRADVDGLRAIAILSVLLFHAGIPGFAGGYAGVDIFFVISGFVIGGLLWRESAAGRFSFGEFYRRRARRLVPALLPVLAATTTASLAIFTPQDLIAFGNNLAWTVVGGSNLELWRWTQDYFAPSTQFYPLLHAWSLAVEEQFYFVMPAVIYLLHRHARRHSVAVILALLAATFLLSALIHTAMTRFYLTPCRAWEFLCGVLISLPATKPLRGPLLRQGAALLGLLVIAIAVSGYEPLPVVGLLPCLGAAMVIYAGNQGTTLVGRLLSTRPIVFIGLISYSLYLWHWPLLAFARYWHVYDLPLAASLAILLLAGVVATLSWRYIERPLRQHAVRGPGWRLSRALVPLGALGFTGLVLGHSDGLPGRLPAEVVQLAAAADDSDPRRQECLLATFGDGPVGGCIYGAPGVEPEVAFWGDSQAAALAPGIGKIAQRSGRSFRLFALAGCRPVLGFPSPGGRCDRYTRAALNAIVADPRLKTVIIAAEYINTIYGSVSDDHGRGRVEGALELGLPVLHPNERTEREALFATQFTDIVAQLVKAGRRVILADPVPDVGVAVPSSLARLAYHGQDWADFTWPRPYYQTRQQFVLNLFEQIVRDHPTVNRVHPQDRLCDTNACRLSADGAPLYIDYYHLTLAGADVAAPAFSPAFEEHGPLASGTP
ncbi:MAG TPA: acyltransferase family protein [Aliidongia sp.]|uniref:acyltransferase family protein n=1 Tax=Aliidongia sp. TaxID=1914230 RepID=UPI002DDCF5CB|nr:acyltransferase family protein [Aliidongia sp.]HEV2675464.1 acyltransferase family protein [Aliidongia sp.]